MKVSWDQCGQEEWELLANRVNAPMPQRWIYGAVHAALGGQVKRAVVWKNGRPVALCQCLIRRIKGVLHLSLATNGPLWLAPCNHRHVVDMIRRSLPVPHPCVNLFTLPKAMKSIRLIPLMTPATHAELTLPVALDSLHGKWRNSLKKAQNSGLRVRHIACPTKSLMTLLETDQQQQIAKSYRALPAAFTLKWHQTNPDDLRLITVQNSGSISGCSIATALFILHGNTATYHIAHTTDAGRKLSAGRLALWRAFGDFAAQGVRLIDLGQIDTVNASGLARFKLGTGAKAQRLGPTVLAL